MAHIWIRDPERNGDWIALLLGGDAVTLTPDPPHVRCGRLSPTPGRPLIWLVVTEPGTPRWVLITNNSGSVFVNGIPLSTGIRVLADRDEITAPCLGRLFFATDEPARVEPFPGVPPSGCCARCQQRLEPETPAVRCPSATCRQWHHERADLNCWTYDERCASCSQPTALDGAHPWTPLEAERASL